MYKKKILKIASIFTIITLFSTCFIGCWNSKELNALGIVGIFALDLEENKIKVTCEAIKPSISKEGKGEAQVTYVESMGETIFDAVRNVTMKFDRKLFFPHIKVYIISEELAKRGLIDYIDWNQRDHEPRRSGYILIAKDMKAQDVLGVKGGIEGVPADYIEKLISFMVANSKIEAVSVLQFLKNYYAGGIEPVVGIVHKVPKVKLDDKIKQESKVELSAEGTGVFLKGKLVGYLNGDETKGFNFIANKVKSGIIVLNKGENNKTTSIEILKSKCKSSVEIEGNIPKIKVKVQVSGVVGEENEKLNLKDPKIIKQVEEMTNKVIKEDIDVSIQKVKNEYKSDIFGFGVIVHRKCPEKWKVIKNNWNEMFSKAQVQVEVSTKIKSTGLVDVPANFMEEK